MFHMEHKLIYTEFWFSYFLFLKRLQLSRKVKIILVTIFELPEIIPRGTFCLRKSISSNRVSTWNNIINICDAHLNCQLFHVELFNSDFGSNVPRNLFHVEFLKLKKSRESPFVLFHVEQRSMSGKKFSTFCYIHFCSMWNKFQTDKLIKYSTGILFHVE